MRITKFICFQSPLLRAVSGDKALEGLLVGGGPVLPHVLQHLLRPELVPILQVDAEQGVVVPKYSLLERWSCISLAWWPLQGCCDRCLGGFIFFNWKRQNCIQVINNYHFSPWCSLFLACVFDTSFPLGLRRTLMMTIALWKSKRTSLKLLQVLSYSLVLGWT